MGKWTRRAFLAAGGLVGGGLVLAVAGVGFAPNRLRFGGEGEAARLTTWIRLTPDNRVTVLVPHCEMGQGIHTALPMMLAEELEADWGLVSMAEAPAEGDFANGYVARGFLAGDVTIPGALLRQVDYTFFRLADVVGVQVTGGSSSVRYTGVYGMQVAGAAAKEMLIKAAAKRWNVPDTECEAKLSRVHHKPSGRSETYGALASDAAKLDVPTHPVLKPRSAYTLVGTSVPRVDIPSKVNGTAIYGVDVRREGMLYGAIMASPVHGGTLVSVDEAPARALPGVKAVVKLDNAVAVVADSYWRAKMGLEALKPVFDDKGNGTVTSETIFASFAAALDGKDLKSDVKAGKGERALAESPSVLDAEYRVPFLAHAPMEPMNATALVADGAVEVWSSVQDPLGARGVAAKAAGVDADKVIFHTVQLGGGFGRRLPGKFDYVDQAVRVAMALPGTPVKLVWSREEDIRHDFYRPAVLARYKAALGSDGAPIAWTARYTGKNEPAPAAHLPYAILNQDIRYAEVPVHVRTGAWRSVAHSQHGFFTESFIDELAHKAGQDPFAYRRALLADAPRHRAALELAAEKAGWSTPVAPGEGRGIALVESFGTIVAEVAEVAVDSTGTLKVKRVVAAVDCGDVINPDGAAAQIEGGILYGLSAAWLGEITIDAGQVAQGNFYDYEVAHLAHAPAVEVHFIRSGHPLGGLGEPGTPPIAPAVANAIFVATGRRVRTLPFKNQDLTPLPGRLAAKIQ